MRILTDAERHEILVEAVGDGNETPLVLLLLEAQTALTESETLKTVGEWLGDQLANADMASGDTSTVGVVVTRTQVAALKRGERPEGMDK